MDIKLYALIKSLVKGVTKGDTGDPGESGFADIVTTQNPPRPFTIYNNTENHVTVTEEGSIYFNFDFSKNYDGSDADPAKSSQAILIFENTEYIVSIGSPATVKWAVATPVFEKGKTYMLSFVPHNDFIIGIWAVIE
ncbi:MAG: hypothetical protein E7635_07615 [Ruminococcaceae bacterium]|nr:hypothetical protein [Oscillospiraceae bacterium]